MPPGQKEQLTGLSSLGDQLDRMQSPIAQRMLKQYGSVVLTRLIDQQRDMRRLSLYDDELRRAADKELGMTMNSTPADEDVRIDSPTTTVNNSGVPPWATALIAGAMALGGIGGGVGLTALLNRPQPQTPAVTQPAAPGTTVIDASSLRATIE